LSHPIATGSSCPRMACASREYSPALPLEYDSEIVRVVLAEFIGHNSVSWGMVVTGDRIAS
jgi:hypothetical protein